MRRSLVFLLVGLLVALASACGSSGATKSGGTKKSGTVTLLTHNAFAASKEVLADFTKQTGYQIKLVQPGDAGVMVNQAILRKGNPLGDVMFGVDNTFLTRALDANLFDPYAVQGVSFVRGAPVDADHRVTPVDQGDVCIDYDTSWFGRKGRPPKPVSLADLTDPRYKNLTVVENAATSSPGLAFLLATISEYGANGWQDYWRKLRANGVRVVNDWTQAYETDFTAGGGPGDRPIVVSYASSPPADVVFSTPHRDTPRVGVVESSCFRQYEFAGVLHGARNPAGARAFVDFLVSRRFQEDMPLQMYVNPVIVGATLPSVYAKWAVIPPNPYTMDPQAIGDGRDAWIKEWTNIVVR
jgi:thiamine transport system substrate-binding protein